MKSVDTKLFVEGLPVDYKITHRKGTYHFEPMFNPHSSIDAPLFSATQLSGIYAFIGTAETELQDQAIEDIKTLFS